MKKFLQLPAWFIFVLSNAGFVIANTKLLEGLTPNWLLKILGVSIYCLYPFAVGYTLNKLLPSGVKLNFKFYLLNSLIWFIGYFVILIYSETKEIEVYALPLLYVFFALVNFIGFPAKAIKSIELRREATVGEYIGEFFHMAFIPVGVWYMHPKILKIMEGGTVTAK